jgi:cytoskeletal protein CcmA (bactofilin family)
MQANADAPAAVSESRVDRDSHFNGLFQTKQNLRIEGIAEGEIQCEGTVTVAEGARVKAKVTASTVTIAGELAGEVICRDVFQIMPSGQVEATVSARRLIVQEGGFYNGEFHMISEDAFSSAIPAFDSRLASEPASLASSSDLMSTDEWWSKLTGDQDASAADVAPDKAPDNDNKNKSRSR